MYLYLVRHGESKGNAQGLTQCSKTELSPYGKKQAMRVARRFQKIPIEIIVSSHYTRARQTAEYIQKATNNKLIFSELLREIKRPTIIEGKAYRCPEVIEIHKTIQEHIHEQTWHLSDEENFFDLRNRARLFLEWIVKRKEKRICAVTHGIFLKTLLFAMMLGNNFTPDFLQYAEHFLITRNTGITLCEYNKRNEWKLITFNDHAHLG